MHISDFTKSTCGCPEFRSQVLLLQPQLGGYSEQRRYVRNTVGTSPSFFLLKLKLVFTVKPVLSGAYSQLTSLCVIEW